MLLSILSFALAGPVNVDHVSEAPPAELPCGHDADAMQRLLELQSEVQRLRSANEALAAENAELKQPQGREQELRQRLARIVAARDAVVERRRREAEDEAVDED